VRIAVPFEITQTASGFSVGADLPNKKRATKHGDALTCSLAGLMGMTHPIDMLGGQTKQ
jgi:hypothetical protein